MNKHSILLVILMIATNMAYAQPRPVKTAPIHNQASHVDQLYGQIRGVRSVDLSFHATGQLVQLNVTPGAQVKKGDLLGKVKSTDIDGQALSAGAGVDVALAQYNQALRELARYKPLYEAGAISKSQYEQVTTGVAMAKAGVKNAKAQSGRAQGAKQDSRLTAPFDGTITKVNVQLYEQTMPTKPVMTLEDLSSYCVQTPFTEDQLSLYPVGSEGEVHIKNRDATLKARLTSRDKDVESSTQTWKGTWTLISDTSDLNLTPGLSATISLKTQEQAHPIVPLACLQAQGDRSFAWLLREGKIVKVPVTVLQIQDDGTAQVDGQIQDHDQAVVAGLNDLQEGMDAIPLETDHQ